MKKLSTSHDWTVCWTTFNVLLYKRCFTSLRIVDISLHTAPSRSSHSISVWTFGFLQHLDSFQLVLVSLKTLYCCMLQWTFLRMRIAMCLISILLVFKICCLKICVIEKSKYAFFFSISTIHSSVKLRKCLYRLWQKMDRQWIGSSHALILGYIWISVLTLNINFFSVCLITVLFYYNWALH